MAEYGRYAKLTVVVRFLNDILLCAPSIIIGLFVYEVVVTRIGHFSGYRGRAGAGHPGHPGRGPHHRGHAAARAEPAARGRQRHGPAALPRGRSRSPTVRPAPASSRACCSPSPASRGETAPLLFTALNNQFWNADIAGPTASLPTVIFQFALSPYKDWQQLAWTGALIITATVLILSIAARSLGSTRTAK